MIRPPGRLLNFWALRVGTYSRWALFQGLWYCKEIVQRVAWLEYFRAMPFIALYVRSSISYTIRCLISSLYNCQTYQCYIFWISKAEYNEFEPVPEMNFLTGIIEVVCIQITFSASVKFGKSDQNQFSSHNIHTSSREKVMRVNKITNKRKMLCSSIKNSQVLLFQGSH